MYKNIINFLNENVRSQINYDISYRDLKSLLSNCKVHPYYEIFINSGEVKISPLNNICLNIPIWSYYKKFFEKFALTFSDFKTRLFLNPSEFNYANCNLPLFNAGFSDQHNAYNEILFLENYRNNKDGIVSTLKFNNSSFLEKRKTGYLTIGPSTCFKTGNLKIPLNEVNIFKFFLESKKHSFLDIGFFNKQYLDKEVLNKFIDEGYDHDIQFHSNIDKLISDQYNSRLNFITGGVGIPSDQRSLHALVNNGHIIRIDKNINTSLLDIILTTNNLIYKNIELPNNDFLETVKQSIEDSDLEYKTKFVKTLNEEYFDNLNYQILEKYNEIYGNKII